MGNLHLVTGYAGEAHVTAADSASLNAAIIGPGDYVLNRGSQFAPTVISNNQIRISDGDILMQGRHIRLAEGSTVDLAIENGVSGQYRNDLIVARYTKDSSTGVEDCNLVVIKGTAVSSNPADPAYTSGDIINDHVLIADMPLYRVPLNGLNVQELVPLFTLVSASLLDAGGDKQTATDKLTTGSDLVDGDYIPFYDASVGDHRKTLWSNIVSKIRTALFGTVNGVLKADGAGNISAQDVDETPTEGSTNLVTSGGVFNAGKWKKIGSWEHGGSLSADFTQYNELMFVYDKDGDNSDGIASIHVLTDMLTDNYHYYGGMYSQYIYFKIKINKLGASTHAATKDGEETNTSYKIYCYAR